MSAWIDRDPVPYQSVGARAFAAEHDWLVLLEDDEMEDAANGIQSSFDNCLNDVARLAARLITLLESVAAPVVGLVIVSYLRSVITSGAMFTGHRVPRTPVSIR